ncbi:MAG: hypothetical protein LUH10_04160 [Tannerellaceae bacterium]|nr:hypothetical protein [Tannerellaceae bacterium]
MSQTEKIKYLLEEVKRLEGLLAGIQDAAIYPVSFFDQSFDLTRKLLKELYQIEANQVETLRKQMEARQAMLQEILLQTPTPEPVPEPELVPNEDEISSEALEAVSEDTQEEIASGLEEEPEILQEPEAGETIEPSPGPGPVSAVRDEKTIEELLREYAPSSQPLSPAEKNTACLGDIIEKKNLADFRKAFSLNDRFYFRRELFANDDSKMNEAIADLNELESLEDSLDYINNKMRWNPEDKPVADFICLLEKRFL